MSSLSPSRTYVWCLALAIFLGSVLAAWLITQARSTPVVLATPQYSASATQKLQGEDLDLGVVWAEPDYHHRIRVKNVGAPPVDVHHISANCDCTSVAPASFTGCQKTGGS